MIKSSKFLRYSLLCSCSVILIVFYSNCSGPATSTSAPTSPGSSNTFCSDSQLANIEANMRNTLSTVVTDVDFSFNIVAEDGREFRYERGTSTMTTPYLSASTSKWPTASIILSYMESSANQNSSHPLRLDSKPQDFLNSTIWPVPPSDPLYNMTLRQLLSFTSGLTNESLCLRPGNGATTNFWDCITSVATDNLGEGSVPGTTFDYNSDHLQVAGAMAIKAHDLALGITTSTWQTLYSEFRARTGLFANSFYNSPSLSNPRLAGGMTWIGSDYMDFLKANYNKQILSASTMPGETAPYGVQQFVDQIDGDTIGNSPAISDIQEDWHYGFGLWLECHSPTFNCQNTVSVWACPGSFGAFPFMDRGHKFYGIIARQGNLHSFSAGYAVYMSVNDLVNQWATKDCSQ